ncbi:MAG: YebC/PmpR family DNA-binding transcriptional regulator [Candidatus Levybacteria bacterium]|nr:YebC/PmpR family DNA-binding transcriptional regulator [Candidatus Levybacteria bacterium]
MSGHSKWSTIKRQKGAADARRGAIFTKISNAITIAVKQGGGIGDPAQNSKLRLAIEMARDANMPKENIERAIKRARERGEGELSELTYEGFAPGGISVLVEAITDNANRTTSEVKNLFNKWGGRLAEPRSVAYQFEQIGEITVAKNEKSIDDIFLTAADLGALDVEDRVDAAAVFTDISSLSKIKDGLATAGFRVLSSEISLRPKTKIKTSQETKDKTINFLSSLEDIDDVQKVYSNIAL